MRTYLILLFVTTIANSFLFCQDPEALLAEANSKMKIGELESADSLLTCMSMLKNELYSFNSCSKLFSLYQWCYHRISIFFRTAHLVHAPAICNQLIPLAISQLNKIRQLP